MMWFASLLLVVYVLKEVATSSIVQQIYNPNEDYVTKQLFDYKKKHPHPGNLTTSAGYVLDTSDTESLNGNLLQKIFFIDSIEAAVNERIPDRIAFAKGMGAKGFINITNNNLNKYTKMKMFEKVGKTTNLTVRFSISEVEKGGSDLFLLSVRGFSLKFYTEEGNFDLLGINIPVYFYRDPILASSLNRAFKPDPKTNILDFTTAIDFVINNPVTCHAFLWTLSEYGLPKGYRYMNAYPIHTYELYTNDGQSHFVRFRILSELGYESFSISESAAISSFDPDFFNRDLYNSIESGDYPSYKLDMLVLKAEDPLKCNFDPFDVTNLWPKDSFEVVEIGKITLNCNLNNNFAQAEVAAFNPGNLVPGIITHDQLMKGRIMTYIDAQIHRLGTSYNREFVNRPISAATYVDNTGDGPNYMPNSFNGPAPSYVDKGKPQRTLNPYEVNDESLKNCKTFYNEILTTEASKQRLVNSLARASMRVHPTYQEKFANFLGLAEEKLAALYRKTLAHLEANVKLPSCVEDVNRTNPNPYSAIDC